MTKPISKLLVSTVKRNQKFQGAVLSANNNALQDEVIRDFLSLQQQWNTGLVPLVQLLPDGTDDIDINAFKNGLDGRTLYVKANATVETATEGYWNLTDERPNTVYEQFQGVYTRISSEVETINNLIAALEAGEEESTADVSSSVSTSTDNALARFDGSTGKIIQNSNAILTDPGALTLQAGLTATTGTFSGAITSASLAATGAVSSATVATSGAATIGGALSAASLSVNTAGANTTAIATLANTAGNFRIFRTDATPNGSVTGDLGDLAVDTTNAVVYIKTVASGTNTDWVAFSTGSVVVPGANTNVLFNDAGSLNATAGMVFDKNDAALTVTGWIETGDLFATGPVEFGDTLVVEGDTEINGNLDVDADVAGDAYIRVASSAGDTTASAALIASAASNGALLTMRTYGNDTVQTGFDGGALGDTATITASSASGGLEINSASGTLRLGSANSLAITIDKGGDLTELLTDLTLTKSTAADDAILLVQNTDVSSYAEVTAAAVSATSNPVSAQLVADGDVASLVLISDPTTAAEIESGLCDLTVKSPDTHILKLRGGKVFVEAGLQLLRVSTGAGTYPAGLRHIIIGVTTSGSPHTVTLPNATTNEGRIYVVKDEGGQAAAGNITVECAVGGQLIDGASDYTISTNYGSKWFYSNGTNYFTV